MGGKPTKAAAGRSKSGADENSGKGRRDHRWFSPVLAELRQVFPKPLKLAEEIAALAGRSIRVVEDWTASPPRGAPDGEALARLFNSRVGDRLFLAMTKASGQPWRRNLNRQIEIGQLHEQQRATAQRLKELERDEA